MSAAISDSARRKADEYLATGERYRLGDLDTEQSHPDTWELSTWANTDLAEAIARLHAVDVAAVDRVVGAGSAMAGVGAGGAMAKIDALRVAVADTLASGARVFLCGCGATGRLALALETVWREVHAGTALEHRIVALMAGGDGALVRARESVEDLPEVGARHLHASGFGARDLLIACTEGGETPYVIGATEHAAAEGGERAPFFLYCNPDDQLRALVMRSRHVLDNPGIIKINLAVGPMALSGSTRMQASTVLMLAVGAALFSADARQLVDDMRGFADWLRAADFSWLAGFIEREAEVYAGQGQDIGRDIGQDIGRNIGQDVGHVLYATDEWGITVLTDTAERGPTFSLTPFENLGAPKGRDTRGLCYLRLAGTSDARAAWQRLLHRMPRQVDDALVAGRGYTWDELQGFDFSDQGPERRREMYGAGARPGLEVELWIGRCHSGRQVAQPLYECMWRMRALGSEAEAATPVETVTATPVQTPVATMVETMAHEARFALPGLGLVYQHIALKLALNIHSTLVMGRLNRYQHNIMTWVRPSNGKLIDRAARYVQRLLADQGGRAHSYEDVVYALFETMEHMAPDHSVVLETLARLR